MRTVVLTVTPVQNFRLFPYTSIKYKTHTFLTLNCLVAKIHKTRLAWRKHTLANLAFNALINLVDETEIRLISELTTTQQKTWTG